MSRTLGGGRVFVRNVEDVTRSVGVERLEFPILKGAGAVPDGTEGELYLTHTPWGGIYRPGDALMYRDEHAESIVLCVDRECGPTRYRVSKR